MFSAVERMVAMRYLRPRRQQGLVSVIAGFSLLGIALGVATLIVVMSVMNGFRAELLGRILGLNGHMGVYSLQAGAIADFDALAEIVRGAEGVVQVAPVVEGQVMATNRKEATGALVRGIRAGDLRDRPLLRESITLGSLADFDGPDAVVIGSRLAQKLGLFLGDKITLISPQGTVTAFGTVPRVRAYRVAAIFEVGMYEYDSTFVFMPLKAAQLFFQRQGRATSLEVMVEAPMDILAARAGVARALDGKARLLDWQQVNSSFFTAIQVERNVMFLILTMIILVAAFNIISGMTMLVKDKGKDIAILRTMGATRGMVLRIFFMSGASIGVAGSLGGLALGLAFADNIEGIRQFLQNLTGTDLFQAEIYFLSNLPSKIEPTQVALVVGMSLGLSFLATLYPAWRAARLDPVEALRYE